MEAGLIWGAIVSVLLSIIFSGMEAAFLSANKLQIELQAKQGNFAAQILTFFSSRQTWFIGTTLIGNLAALIFFGICATGVATPWLNTTVPFFAGNVPGAVIALIFILTLALLYSVELLSKGFFIIHSNKIVSLLAIPFAVIGVVLFPVVFLLVTLARFLSANVLKLEYSKEKPVFGLTDVSQYVKSIHPAKRDDQNIEVDKKIFTNALDFRSVRIRDCMIPRTEITGVSLDAGIKKLQEAFLESGHSKIVIYRETIDDVIGYCHSAALFKNPSRIEEILTPIITVPETTMAKDLMVRFINDRKSLAIVVDEFGGTSGIVSMEDVIEEIFGEIEDEHDESDRTEQKLEENVYLLSARLEIDYLNEKYGWQLPVGDYDTVSGLILSHTEDLPDEGEAISIPPFTFIIHSTEENRIDTVKIVIAPPTEEH